MYILANRDIELICDETVVKSYEPDGKTSYALTLIKLEEIKSRVAIVNYFSKNFVEERMTAIMKTKKYTAPVMILALILVVAATVAFAASAASSNGTKDDASLETQMKEMLIGFDGVVDVDITITEADDGTTDAKVNLIMTDGKELTAGQFQQLQNLFLSSVPADKENSLGISAMSEGDAEKIASDDFDTTDHRSIEQPADKVKQLTEVLEAIDGVGSAAFDYFEVEGNLPYIRITMVTESSDTDISHMHDEVVMAISTVYPEIAGDRVFITFLPPEV